MKSRRAFEGNFKNKKKKIGEVQKIIDLLIQIFIRGRQKMMMMKIKTIDGELLMNFDSYNGYNKRFIKQKKNKR